MAERALRALERQLEALQKVYASQMAGGFPQLVLTYGDETFDEAVAKLRIDYDALQELGITIKHVALPWLQARRISYGDPMPDAGSEVMTPMGAV